MRLVLDQTSGVDPNDPVTEVAALHKPNAARTTSDY
jgi:hypothetical protein